MHDPGRDTTPFTAVEFVPGTDAWMVTGPLNFCAPVVISSAFSRKVETLAVL